MVERYDWHGTAKNYQIAPEGNWHTWYLTGSRGAGTTRAGVEWIREKAREPDQRLLIVTRTASDTREVFVEGESGIMAMTPELQRPQYEPAKRRLTWMNGTQAILTSADEPDKIRGIQAHKTLWMDPRTDDLDTFNNVRIATRLGDMPQLLVAGMLNRKGSLFDVINHDLIKDPAHTRLTSGSWQMIEEHLEPRWIKVMKEMGSIT